MPDQLPKAALQQTVVSVTDEVDHQRKRKGGPGGLPSLIRKFVDPKEEILCAPAEEVSDALGLVGPPER